MSHLIWVFWAWIAFSVVYWLLGVSQSRVEEAPVASPFASERAAQERYREFSRRRFGPKVVAYFVLANGAGGLLLHYASSAAPWAAPLLAVVCLWLIYDNATSPFALRGIHPRLVDTLDWIYFATGGAVWLYALACIGVQWLR